MDLSELLESISDVSYEIEYEENLKFAREFLNLKGEDARKKFAKGAALEQKELDIEAIESAKKKEILYRLAERRKLLSVRSEKVKVQKAVNELEELFETLKL